MGIWVFFWLISVLFWKLYRSFSSSLWIILTDDPAYVSSSDLATLSRINEIVIHSGQYLKLQSNVEKSLTQRKETFNFFQVKFKVGHLDTLNHGKLNTLPLQHGTLVFHDLTHATA
jgi:hypothetical protein